MGIRLQDMKMDREFKQANTVTGKETKKEVLTRLGIEPEVVHEPKPATKPQYKVVDGIAYKVVAGQLVPLKTLTNGLWQYDY